MSDQWDRLDAALSASRIALAGEDHVGLVAALEALAEAAGRLADTLR